MKDPLQFDWDPNKWHAVHNGKTSQLGGLKPGCRLESFGEPPAKIVGLFRASGKKISGTPLVVIKFQFTAENNRDPTNAEIVEGLKAEVEKVFQG